MQHQIMPSQFDPPLGGYGGTNGAEMEDLCSMAFAGMMSATYMAESF